MPATRITNFGGVIPRLAPRQLPGESAREAASVSLLPGELRPMRKSLELYAPYAAEALLSFFRADDTNWFVWPTAYVQMEKAPLEGDTRFVYTGDGVPKITTLALGTPVGPTGVPAAARTLGIPEPLAAPGLAHVGGVGAASTRYYVYTFYSDWDEESAPSPVSAQIIGKVDGTWNVTAMEASPPNTGSVTAASYAAGFVTVTLGAGNHYLRAGEAHTIAGVTGMTDLNGAWVVDSVPAANQIKIALTTAQVYTAGGTWTRSHPWGACTKRIYRTTGLKADFQLVVDGITGTSYADTLTDAQIPGDSLISQGWVPPPVDMVGLVQLNNGVMAGFVPGGKTVCLSEPYQPHAWPTRYRKKVSDEIVGLAAYDTNLVAATKGFPVVFSGLEPEQMTPTRHPKPLPALSRASVCSVDDGVVYASKNGMVRVDLVGAALFTEGLFTPDGWNGLSPATMASAFDGSRLLIATTVNKRIYVLDMLGSGGQLVTSVQRMDAVKADSATGDIYFAFGRKVFQFDSFERAPMTMDWWSKEYVLAKPTNQGAARVEYDQDYSDAALALIDADRAAIAADNASLMSSALGGHGSYNSKAWNVLDIDGSELADLPAAEVVVSFTYYADGKPIFSKVVPSQQMFKLPSGYKSDTFSVRIQANTQVRSIAVAETAKQLADV